MGSRVSVASDDVLRALRMRAQLLAGDRAGDVLSVVSRVCGVQAQAAPPARLAVRVRSSGLLASTVDAAVRGEAVRGQVVRTWAMRGTLHMLARGDVAWLVGLLGPVFDRAGRRRRDQLGLDDRTCERALPAIERVLADSPPLTRAVLVERLADEGVRLDPRSQAPAHLLHHAANHGLVCRGPDLARDEPTYVLTGRWLGADAANPFPDRGDALAELARRYLAGHGLAAVADLARWSGLPLPDARRAFASIADETTELATDRGPMLVLRDTPLDAPDLPAPRLLGHFDPLLLGYRDRDLVLDPAFAGRVQAGGGFIRPSVLIGGRVVGTWTLRRSRTATVTVEPFAGVPRGVEDGLRSEVDDLARFLGEDAELRIEAPVS